MKTAIHNKVMRRVYYSYALSIVEHSMFWQGAVLGACIAAFGRLTHVAALIHNFLAVPIGATPKFVVSSFVGALEHGEFITAVVVVMMAVLSLSFIVRAMPLFIPHKMAV